MISVCFQGKPFNIKVIQFYAPTSNTEEAEIEQFYEDLQDLLELIPPKKMFQSIDDQNFCEPTNLKCFHLTQYASSLCKRI